MSNHNSPQNELILVAQRLVDDALTADDPTFALVAVNRIEQLRDALEAVKAFKKHGYILHRETEKGKQ